VIDHTEALISVDVNSARATKGSDIEETALNTNREAAEEVARQLRLRDLGGLVVIDFIDMSASRNQRDVENTLREALKMDRARVQIGRISRFGLLEMSRQRLRPSLGESVQIVCPRCEGHGTIRGTESLALSILRIIEEDAMKEQTARIVVQVPVNVATFLLNEKRQAITEIEERQKIKVVLIPNPTFDTPHYEVQRERASDLAHDADSQASYSLAVDREEVSESLDDKPKLASEVPAVQGVTPAAPVPQQAAPATATATAQSGLIKRIWSSLVGSGESTEAAPEKPAEKTARAKPTQNRSRGGRDGSSSRSGQNRRPARRNQNRGKQDDAQNKSGQNKSDQTRNAKTVTDKKPKTDNKQNTRGQNRNQKQDVSTTETATETTGNEQQNTEQNTPHEGQQNSSSRRGRRGGRRRRPGSNRTQNAEANGNTNRSSENAADANGNKAIESRGESAEKNTANTQTNKPEGTTTPVTQTAERVEKSTNSTVAENQPAVKPVVPQVAKQESAAKPKAPVTNTPSTESAPKKTQTKPASLVQIETKPALAKTPTSTTDSASSPTTSRAAKPATQENAPNNTTKPTAVKTKPSSAPQPPVLNTPVAPRTTEPTKKPTQNPEPND
jgi:ribonuclease E